MHTEGRFRQYCATEPPPNPTTNAFRALSRRDEAVLCTTQPRKTACSGAPMRWTPMTPPLFTRYLRSPSSTTRGAPHDLVVEKSVAAPAINAAASIDLCGSPDDGAAASLYFCCFCSCFYLPPFSFVLWHRLRCCTQHPVAAGKPPHATNHSAVGRRSSADIACASGAMLQRWRVVFGPAELRASGM